MKKQRKTNKKVSTPKARAGENYDVFEFRLQHNFSDLFDIRL
jgi:hypothetical protein